MGDITQYLIKVICASVLCGILNQLIKSKNAVSSVVKMISGIFVAVTVISPLVNLEIDPKLLPIDDLYKTGALYRDDGEEIAAEERSRYIKEMTQSYILDKATSFGAELEVEVILSNNTDEPIQSVVLQGDVSPYVKNQLSHMLTGDLGIPKEAQLWKN